MIENVDMNVIILEGVALYIALAIFLFFAIAALVLAWSGVKQDTEIKELNEEIVRLNVSNTNLINENWRYRLKFGALDVKPITPPTQKPGTKERP